MQVEPKANIPKKVKGISLRLIIEAIILLAAIGVFAFIANEIVLENENGLDVWAFQKLHGITDSAMTTLMLGITFFGSSYFLIPAYLLLIFFFLVFRKNRRDSLDVASFSILSTIVLFSLKAIFHRHRPLDPLVHNVNGFSFPSGHSFSAFTFFGLLVYIVWNTHLQKPMKWLLTIVFIFFACAIAISRVYLHVHFASDVIAGLCLCVVWLTISFWVMRMLRKVPE